MSACQGKQSYSIDKFEDVIDLGHEAFDHYLLFHKIVTICLYMFGLPPTQ